MPLTRRLILQKARHHHNPTKIGPTGSDGFKAPGFRNYFTPLPGYFSPFPHGTNTLSVIKKYSGLPSGLGRFTQDSTSPALLGHTPSTINGISPTRLSRSPVSHPRLFNYTTNHTPNRGNSSERHAPQHRTRNPCRVSHAHGLAIIRFRSPLLTEYLFLRVLRCFTSPRSSHTPYKTQARVTRYNPG